MKRKETMSTSRQTRTDVRHDNKRYAVVNNERMTALAGALLLVLILVELVTAFNLHALISAHIFVGLFLAGPLAVKLGSTGYRFLRYYTRSPAFVRKGPPKLALRVLAPLLLVTTFVVIGSGIGLLVTGPDGPFFRVHAISVLIWIPIVVIHVYAHIRTVPRLIIDDWRKHPAEKVPGRGRRLGVSIGALMVGAIVAILMLPVASPWIVWSKTNGSGLPSPLIAGMIIAIIAVLVTRPHRWR
jgi:hypothetical protein